MRNSQRWLVLGLGLVLASVCWARGPSAGGRALVLSQNMGTEHDGALAEPFLGGAVAVSLKHSYSVVEVSTGDYRLRLLENGANGFYGLIVLPVNQSISYTIEDHWFVVRDFKNHKHRFAVVGVEAIGENADQAASSDALVTK